MFAWAAAEKGWSCKGLLVAWTTATMLVVASGCGGASGTTDSQAQPPVRERSVSQEGGDDTPALVRASHCPAGLPGCRATQGRIVYVERVDPDGDGDAHFVVVDPQGITLPGLTAIDVRKGLRPHPLPGPSDLISAAGPVQTGSYGQSQIHALELHVGR